MLPRVLQRGAGPHGPLDAILTAMEQLHVRSEEELAALDATLDSRRTVDAFVPYLASWVDLERLFEESSVAVDGRSTDECPISTGMLRLRAIVGAASWLSQRRGTAQGLVRFLQTATGLQEFSVDESVPGDDGLPRPFHIRVRGPETARPHEPLLHRIIRSERPAYVTYELVLGNRRSEEGE